MSTVTPETVTEEAIIGDSSRVEEKLLKPAIARLVAAAQTFGALFFKGAEAKREMAAARVEASLAITLENGHPDWARKSDAYKIRVKSEERRIIGEQAGRTVSDTEWRALDSNVRNYTSDATKAAIVEYVKEKNPSVQVKLAGQEDKAEGWTAAFSKLVVAEYKSTKPSNLSTPNEFLPAGQQNAGGGGGGRGRNEATGLSLVSSNVESVRDIVPMYAALCIERESAQLAERLVEMDKDPKGEGIPERVRTLASMHNARLILFLTAKRLEGNALSEKESKSLDAAMIAAKGEEDSDGDA